MVEQVAPSENKHIEQLQQLPNVRAEKQETSMFGFDGAWLPSVDPALIGPKNFQKLVNMRYSDTGIEGVTGYTKINTTALTTYTSVKNGIHLRTQGRTVSDYTLVHAVDPDTGQGRIYENRTAIGSQGDFEATQIHADTSVNLTGRFSEAPSGAIAYCNKEEALIYGGDESLISFAAHCTTAAEALPIDVTEKVINSETDSANIFTYNQASRQYLTILTNRPAIGFKFYVASANVSAGTLSCKYWDGDSYAAVANASDGTDTGPALGQTGWFTFDAQSDAALHHFQERYLYAYQFDLSAGSADISEITVKYAMQKPTNVWDGIYRTPTQCQVYTNADTSYEDFTLHVSESSSLSVPVGCILDGFVATNDKLILMFDEKLSGIRFTMLGDLINTNASVMTLKYWDGDAFTTVGEFGVAGGCEDGTASNSKTFGKSGLVQWNPKTDEEKTTLFGVQGYAYEITVGSTLSGAKAGDEEIVVDLITGVPAQKSIKTYQFPVKFKDKLLLCNYAEGNEGNRIDFSEDNAPDIFNGENTSFDGWQSIYVGGSDYLTCATQLYNRFGSNLFASLAIFKDSELYLMIGDSPLDYQLYPVSQKIGCPAPETLATAEVGFELSETVAKNIALFVSNSGPMMYDGATLKEIDGLDVYFDPNESTCVNFDYLDTAKGWFDSTYKEYNILLPIGSSQTTLNYWLVYDIVRKKWFQKDTGSGAPIQCGFPVKASNGNQHVYGGTLTGFMMRLENGANWAGSEIQNEVQTGDFFPSKSEWDITRIRRLKFSAVRVTESGAQVEFYYYGGTDDDGGLQARFTDAAATLCNSAAAGVTFKDLDTLALNNSGTAGLSWSSASASTLDLAITSGLNRLMRKTSALNQSNWCHSFKFIFSSSSTNKGMQPIMWGVEWEFVRRDYNDN